MACNDQKAEVNSVVYPGTPDCPRYDTVENWPATTVVTQTTGEDITRNRDALLVLERILGLNPHIGLFTVDPRRATVSQRISILEQGISEGRFELRRLKVERAIETEIDPNQNITLALGAPKTVDYAATQVEFRGPLRVVDSDAPESRALFEVGIIVRKSKESGLSPECLIEGSSSKSKPLLRISDFNRTDIASADHIALQVDGNLHVNGYLTGNFSLDHTRLNNINTDPVIDAKGVIIVDATHVSRGNFHSHKRGEYDSALGRWLVDPNPRQSTYGLIDHTDLEPVSTRTSIRQQNFIPDPNVAYHVTNGDDHDHVGGDGAPLRHKFLLGIDPKNSDHVTNGDFHTHNPDIGDGAVIPTHGIVLQENLQDELTAIGELQALANLSTVLTTINAKFTSIDALDAEQNSRLETNEAAIEEAKIAKQDLNLVRAEVSTLKADITGVAADVSALETTVATQSTDIETLKATQLSAVLTGVTVTELNVNDALYGIGGITGQTVTIALNLVANVPYQDATGDPPVDVARSAAVNFTTATATGTIGPALAALEASTLLPKKGYLSGLAIRATSDLPSGAIVTVTIWKNGAPTSLTQVITHTGETGIPPAVIDQNNELEVEAGDLITFGYFNQGSANVTAISIMSCVAYTVTPE